MKPEAIFEVESGSKLSAYDITAASMVRSQWYEAVRQFFQKFDYMVLPTAQVFAFDVEIHWPQDIAGTKMQSYHEWMKGVLVTGGDGQTMSASRPLSPPQRREAMSYFCPLTRA
jgi:amidase